MLLVTTASARAHNPHMPLPSTKATEMDARLQRIKQLTEELTRVQTDSPRQRELAERISQEIDAARAALKPIAENQPVTRMSPDETCVCGSLLFPPELESGIRVPANTDYVCLDYVCLHCGRPYRWVGNPPELTLLVAADRRDDGDDDDAA
jgi:hypothetical protein